MKLGTDNKNQTMIAGGVGLLAVLVVGYQMYGLFGPSTPAPAAAPVIVAQSAPVITTTSTTSTKGVVEPPGFAVGGAAKKIASTSGQLDPSLHEEAMHLTESVIYSGSGRNIFGAGMTVAQNDIPKPLKPVRTVAFVPPPPAPYVPPPYVPPPIELKFFGTTTATNGDRRAYLLHGEDVFLASAGDIVQRRYRVVSIAANSIVIDDMPNNNKQTLPLQAN